jgi:hypothetical protein
MVVGCAYLHDDDRPSGPQAHCTFELALPGARRILMAQKPCLSLALPVRHAPAAERRGTWLPSASGGLLT